MLKNLSVAGSAGWPPRQPAQVQSTLLPRILHALAQALRPGPERSVVSLGHEPREAKTLGNADSVSVAKSASHSEGSLALDPDITAGLEFSFP